MYELPAFNLFLNKVKELIIWIFIVVYIAIGIRIVVFIPSVLNCGNN